MELNPGNVYQDKQGNMFLVMGEILHALKIKDDYVSQYHRKGEAQHTETKEVIDLYTHESGYVIGVTRGLTRVTKMESLVIYQDLVSKKIWARPGSLFKDGRLIQID